MLFCSIPFSFHSLKSVLCHAIVFAAIMALINRSCRVSCQSFARQCFVARRSPIRNASHRMISGPNLKNARAKKSSFGFLLDIDGVLIRGRKIIPGAREALEKLQNSNIPTLFLTNGGCELESDLSERLSLITGVQVGELKKLLRYHLTYSLIPSPADLPSPLMDDILYSSTCKKRKSVLEPYCFLHYSSEI